MLLVQGPHLENHCMTAFCSEYGVGGAGNGREGWRLGAGISWRGRGTVNWESV